MTDRQFLWGLSNGIIVLTMAGTFWLGLGFGPHLGGEGWAILALFTVVVYGTCALILWRAVRLRGTAGFKRSELKGGDERQQAETRRIMAGFWRVGLLQAILISLAVMSCIRLGREELVFPAIGLIVSLHFIPLGRIFHIRAYYFVGIAGTAISLAAFSTVIAVERQMFLGGAMGVLLWLTAAYMLWRADRIVAKAIRDRWRV